MMQWQGWILMTSRTLTLPAAVSQYPPRTNTKHANPIIINLALENEAMTLSHIRMPRTNGIRPLLILAIAASGLTVGTPASAEPPFRFRHLHCHNSTLPTMPENDTCLKTLAVSKAECRSDGGTVVVVKGDDFCKTPTAKTVPPTTGNSTTQGNPKPKPGCTLRPDSPC